MTRWTDAVGEASAERYAERFTALAASGADVHGEASFCEQLAPPGAHVLDAGCGTGRVAIELSRRGFRCVGVDVDSSMISHARRAAPDISWVEQDLTTLHLPERFDLVLAVGNVIPLLAPGTEAATLVQLAAHVDDGGVLVTGLGLDPAHLPLESAPFGLVEYDAWCEQAGLLLVDRFATWDRQPYGGGCYAVSVHHRGMAASDISNRDSTH
ncbi:MAG: class I SAM-dependent methyltransferase [Nocardioidaceae bacterium]|nr:class I SAM-dependent methyltransferase [Nocardioidaceae bacterium]